MNQQELNSALSALANSLKIPDRQRWQTCDDFWPFLERMRELGAVVIIKLDGERTRPGDAGPYTVAVLGGPLAPHSFRRDDFVLADALARAVLEFPWAKPTTYH